MTMNKFETWRDIKAWFEDNGFQSLANRMQVNNDCWNSCGEFGRSQVLICDSMRFCDSEEERYNAALDLDEYYNNDITTEIYDDALNGV